MSSPETMLAARYRISTGEFAVGREPVPEPGRGEVRVKVAAAGVCLSDVHLLDGSLKPTYLRADTVTPGHETSGTVDGVGEGVSSVRQGQRVLVQAGRVLANGETHTSGFDFDGGWAEYAVATADTVVPIPDDLPFEQAAIIPDAVSTPWAALTRTGEVRAARAAAVWGTGGLGAHAVQLLRVLGAAPIIAVDPLAAARERAVEFGADIALDAAAPDVRAQVLAATGGRGLDYAFDMAGFPSVWEQALTCLGEFGRLVLVGLSGRPLTVADSTTLIARQQQIRGSYGSGPEHVLELLALARHGRLDLSRSISGVFPLAEAEKVVARLRTKEGFPIRLILKP